MRYSNSIPNHLKTIGLFTLSIIAATPVQAGAFNLVCSYSSANLSACAEVVSDLVTDKFLAKFPNQTFSIFVHSDVHSYSSGGYVAYAVAGVVPKGLSQFPLRRFSSSTIERNQRGDALTLANVEKENFRDAVKQLMDQCEISPTCDIYTPRTGKK